MFVFTGVEGGEEAGSRLVNDICQTDVMGKMGVKTGSNLLLFLLMSHLFSEFCFLFRHICLCVKILPNFIFKMAMIY